MKCTMKWTKNWLCLAASLLAMGTFALAAGPDDPATMSQDPNQWVLPLGSYQRIRHSKLSQINPDNAAKLKVAWTMSTGTLRGQEGQPLVVGDMMYFESSYPNFVYAVEPRRHRADRLEVRSRAG